MTVASGVQAFEVVSNPELKALGVYLHSTDPLVMLNKIPYAGSSGQVDGTRSPDGFHVALSGITTTSGVNRAKVGVVGYVQWANDAVMYAKFLPDATGFWVAISADATCTLDSFQVDWLVYWI